MQNDMKLCTSTKCMPIVIGSVLLDGRDKGIEIERYIDGQGARAERERKREHTVANHI